MTECEITWCFSSPTFIDAWNCTVIYSSVWYYGKKLYCKKKKRKWEKKRYWRTCLYGVFEWIAHMLNTILMIRKIAELTVVGPDSLNSVLSFMIDFFIGVKARNLELMIVKHTWKRSKLCDNGIDRKTFQCYLPVLVFKQENVFIGSVSI